MSLANFCKSLFTPLWIAAAAFVAVAVSAGSQSHAQDLVPVEEKRMLDWGQPPIRPRARPASAGPEELPAPLPDGAVQAAVSPQEEEGSLDLDALAGADREGITGVPSEDGTDRNAEIIRQRYPDGSVQIERHVTQDENGSYVNHGPWILKSPRGDVMARGYFEAGKMSGMWQRWHPDERSGLFADEPFARFRGPYLSVCSFAEGKMHGQWIVMDARRNKIMEIPYTAGKRDGIASWYWPDGSRMRQVHYVEGQRHGEVMEWDTEQKITRRETWEHDRQQIVRQTWYHRDQPKTEYHYLGVPVATEETDDWWNARLARYTSAGDGTRHGPSLEWFANGQHRMKGQYREGKEQGEFSWWFESGQRQIGGQYLDGARQGIWRWWHANGQLAIEGEYHQDKPVGLWIWRDEHGTVIDRKEITRGDAVEELEGIEASTSGDGD